MARSAGSPGPRLGLSTAACRGEGCGARATQARRPGRPGVQREADCAEPSDSVLPARGPTVPDYRASNSGSPESGSGPLISGPAGQAPGRPSQSVKLECPPRSPRGRRRGAPRHCLGAGLPKTSAAARRRKRCRPESCSQGIAVRRRSRVRGDGPRVGRQGGAPRLSPSHLRMSAWLNPGPPCPRRTG